jgi:hypothetical protein
VAAITGAADNVVTQRAARVQDFVQKEGDDQ